MSCMWTSCFNCVAAEKNIENLCFFFPMARQPLGGLGRLIFRGFTITHFRHATLGRTPLDEGPARRRDLYLTTHNTQKRQTSMPPGGIRTQNPSKRAAADPRLRPHGHWDRLNRVPCTVEPGYNNIGLSDTSSKASQILWYQLIPPR
jgi:hypothetical protein